MNINVFVIPEALAFVFAICIVWFIGMIVSCIKEFFRIAVKKMEIKEKERSKDEKRGA